MASSSKLKPSTGDEDQEEELERFDDFTLASSWERFISEIEAICRQWLTIGPKVLLEKGAEVVGLSQNLYRVKSELKYITKSYSMEYYFEINSGGKTAVWDLKMHDLQLCFGVKEFLVIAPLSASGVILDAPEASKLLSAVAIALSNCCSVCSLWPAFVPVHDPSRKSYIGIQNMGTVFTRRFEADRLSSQVPVKLMHLEGLYELFVSKFAFSTLDLAMHSLKVHFTMRSTYKTISDDDDDNLGIRITESTEHEADPSGESNNKSQWDDDCPWSEWYTSEDPVKGAELIAVWPEKVVESSLEMAELENTSPHDAETWMILPIFSQNLDSSGGNRVGFASQLRLLVDALDLSFSVQFMEDFVSAENPGSDNLKSSMVVPPPSVLDRVFKDLFHEAGIPNFAEGEHKKSRFIKGAPLGSLFAQFCLHSLWVGNCNIRAIAVLWIEFVREVRWCWEESQPLPKMPCDGSIDLSTCLINQKLQMLAICIEKKSELNEEFEDCIGSNEHNNNRREEDGAVTGNRNATQMSRGNFNRTRDSTANHENVNVSVATSSSSSMRRGVVSSAKDSSDYSRRGSAGAVNSMMLLKSYKSLHTPFTQAAPPMTEDMHEERLHAVEAFENSFDFSAQLEKDILTSDMSAFKAANPDAVFEDFIRWHSPGDWVSEETKEKPTRSSSTGDLKDDWPPRGCLSKRMSDHGNLWRKLWDNAPALPALEQKPLLDPSREGEKILHYLETLQPHQLLEQMVCTAFRASADTLNQTNFGDLKQMVTKIEQLYSTISSTLRPLQKNRLCPKSETIEDLRQLCTVFEHVEKLLAVAASLHRKFLQAPRLSSKIFSDYYNFYLPSMGTGSRDADQKEFDMRQRVSNHERQVVSNLFVPPSASQSWRKVLSMGNLLNGHEPIIREIIFYVQESLSDHYAARNPRSFQQDIETYRMYISGTSNDLRVALSVTSCD